MRLRYGDHRGQTLLEAIVAIGVILAAVIGSATLIISSITSGRISQSRVEAANFAREGIEVVRSLRDSNWLKFEQGDPDPAAVPAWDAGLTAGVKRLTFTKTTSTLSGTRFVWQLPICAGSCLTSTVGACAALEQMGIYQVTELATGRVFFGQYPSIANCNFAGYTCVATKYFRTMTLTDASEDLDTSGIIEPEENYLLVQSKVQWEDRTGCKTVTAESRFYDWK